MNEKITISIIMVLVISLLGCVGTAPNSIDSEEEKSSLFSIGEDSSLTSVEKEILKINKKHKYVPGTIEPYLNSPQLRLEQSRAGIEYFESRLKLLENPPESYPEVDENGIPMEELYARL